MRNDLIFSRLLPVALAGLGIGILTTPHKGVATLSFGLLSSGLSLRKHRVAHAGFMASGIVIDIGLVILLQITRGAIQTTMGGTLNPIQLFHVACATLATVLYFPVLYTGASLLLGTGQSRTRGFRKLHLTVALTAYGVRALSFILMFSMTGVKS